MIFVRWFNKVIGDMFMIKDVVYDSKKQEYVIIFSCGATYKTKDYLNAKAVIDRKFAA